MDKLKQIIISLSIKQIQADGIKDEVEGILLSENLVKDASLEEPQTEKGKNIRIEALKALQELENGIESPYIDKPKYDMNALYDRTSNQCIKPIFDILAKYAGPELGRRITAPNEESDKALFKVMQDMGKEVLDVTSENKVPLIWIPNLIQDLKAIIGDLEMVIKTQVKGHRKEVASRAIGIRHPSPENNGFNDDYATYAELLKAREKIIEQTGGNPDDYKQDFKDAIE